MTVADAYSSGATGWVDGPGRVYGVLAERLVATSPASLAGRLVLDLGAGAGIATRAITAAGGRVIAADIAYGMLAADRTRRPLAVVADARQLPLPDRAFGAVVAAFCLNHLDDPVVGVRETGRVIERGGYLVASTYAADDDHPAKRAVEAALTELGWRRPPWYDEMKAAMAAWGTVDAATRVVERGGMVPVRVEHCAVPFEHLGPADLVAWRLGLAQSAAFVAGLDALARAALTARAVELLGPDPEMLVRRVIFLTAAAP